MKLNKIILSLTLLFSVNSFAQNSLNKASQKPQTTTNSSLVCDLNKNKNINWQAANIIGKSIAEKNKQDTIVEFFSYACIHCASAVPVMEKLEQKAQTIKNSPKIEYIPVSFNKTWEEAAKLYYALILQDAWDKKIHSKIFDAYHLDKKKIFTSKKELKTLLDIYIPQKSQKVIDSMDSFDVKNKINIANEYMKSYQITSTPNIVIDLQNGQDALVTPSLTNGIETMYLAVEQFLSDDCRKSLKK